MLSLNNNEAVFVNIFNFVGNLKIRSSQARRRFNLPFECSRTSLFSATSLSVVVHVDKVVVVEIKKGFVRFLILQK